MSYGQLGGNPSQFTACVRSVKRPGRACPLTPNLRINPGLDDYDAPGFSRPLELKRFECGQKSHDQFRPESFKSSLSNFQTRESQRSPTALSTISRPFPTDLRLNTLVRRSHNSNEITQTTVGAVVRAPGRTQLDSNILKVSVRLRTSS